MNDDPKTPARDRRCGPYVAHTSPLNAHELNRGARIRTGDPLLPKPGTMDRGELEALSV